MKLAWLALAILGIAASAQANSAPAWQLNQEHSSLSWQATQNDAPVSGQFTRFSADIAFSPEALEASSVSAKIDITSLTTSYSEAQNTLLTADWLAPEAFPEAVFNCDAFTALGENNYRCDGTLTLKGAAHPFVLRFSLDEYGEQTAAITGTGTLARTAYAIGWSETGQVGDDITIRVKIKASR